MALTYLRSRGLAAGVGGKVLQVVTATDSTERSTSSTTFVTGSNTLSVSITPSSTSSKIFVIVCATAAAENTTQSYYTIYRGATNLGNSNGLFQSYGTGGTAQTNCALSYLDSPSSTSALTYQVYFRKASGGYNIFLNYGSTLSSITAFELGRRKDLGRVMEWGLNSGSMRQR